MKRTVAERNIVVLLFVLVLVAFGYAQKESRVLEERYKSTIVKRAVQGNEKTPAVVTAGLPK